MEYYSIELILYDNMTMTVKYIVACVLWRQQLNSETIKNYLFLKTFENK